MNIDWKKVCQSPGYKSMKASVIRGKTDERYEQVFRFAINRAKHYAIKQNVSLETILNAWESKRTYSFLNYYKDCNQPKLHNNMCKRIGFKAHLKYYLKDNRFQPSKKEKSARVKRFIESYRKQNSTKKPARWSMEHKKREIRLKDYRNKQNI